MDVNAGRVLNAGDFDIVRDGRRNRTEGQQEKREEGVREVASLAAIVLPMSRVSA